MKMSSKLLRAFDRWFTSSAGVWQTVIVCTAIVILEQTHVINDSNGFWLLYYLTFYSAITQPMLAHSGKENGEKLETLTDEVKKLLSKDVQLDSDSHKLLLRMAKKLEIDTQ